MALMSSPIVCFQCSNNATLFLNLEYAVLVKIFSAKHRLLKNADYLIDEET